MTNKKSFTALEILASIAIISILMVIFVNVYHYVRENGKSATCQLNLKTLTDASQSYHLTGKKITIDNSLSFYLMKDNTSSTYYGLGKLIEAEYVNNDKKFYCPSIQKNIDDYAKLSYNGLIGDEGGLGNKSNPRFITTSYLFAKDITENQAYLTDNFSRKRNFHGNKEYNVAFIEGNVEKITLKDEFFDEDYKDSSSATFEKMQDVWFDFENTYREEIIFEKKIL